MGEGGLSEVLSGEKPLKFEVSLETKSAIILLLVIFIAVWAARKATQ